MKEVYYKKVGRRYVPVSEYDSDLSYALPKGAHLIMSYPGGQSTRYHVEPNYAAMIAAGRVAEDVISNAIVKASEARPRTKPITDRQRKAWKELAESFGEDRYYIELPSAREIADAGIKALQDEAEKLMTVPAVRKAYDQFLLVCALTKDEQNELKS